MPVHCMWQDDKAMGTFVMGLDKVSCFPVALCKIAPPSVDDGLAVGIELLPIVYDAVVDPEFLEQPVGSKSNK